MTDLDKALTDLKKVGFDVPREVSKFFKDFETYFTHSLEDLEKDASHQVKEWKTSLQKVLGDKRPSKYDHKLRPVERLYPFMGTGRLKDSIKSLTIKRITPKGFTLTLWGSIGLGGATNEGFNRRSAENYEKYGTPNWYSWGNRVLYEGSKEVKSLGTIFNDLVKKYKVEKKK